MGGDPGDRGGVPVLLSKLASVLDGEIKLALDSPSSKLFLFGIGGETGVAGAVGAEPPDTAEGGCEAKDGPKTDSMLSAGGTSTWPAAFTEEGVRGAFPGVVGRFGLAGAVELFGLISPPLLDLASAGALTPDPGRRFFKAASTSLDTIATRDQSFERILEMDVRICRSTAITSHSANGELPSRRPDPSCIGVPPFMNFGRLIP